MYEFIAAGEIKNGAHGDQMRRKSDTLLPEIVKGETRQEENMETYLLTVQQRLQWGTS